MKKLLILLRFIIQSTIRKGKTWSPGTNSRLAFAVIVILNLSNVELVHVFSHDRMGLRDTNRPRKPRHGIVCFNRSHESEGWLTGKGETQSIH